MCYLLAFPNSPLNPTTHNRDRTTENSPPIPLTPASTSKCVTQYHTMLEFLRIHSCGVRFCVDESLPRMDGVAVHLCLQQQVRLRKPRVCMRKPHKHSCRARPARTRPQIYTAMPATASTADLNQHPFQCSLTAPRSQQSSTTVKSLEPTKSSKTALPSASPFRRRKSAGRVAEEAVAAVGWCQCGNPHGSEGRLSEGRISLGAPFRNMPDAVGAHPGHASPLSSKEGSAKSHHEIEEQLTRTFSGFSPTSGEAP